MSKKNKRKYDISGWATKANVRCTDGRVILPDAFSHQDGARVPLVWNHEEVTMDSVFGHADLSARDGSMYCDVMLNDSDAGQTARSLIKNGDVNAFSISAKNVIQHGMEVQKGTIKELSLVLAPANPGAVIENVGFEHNDGVGENEMIIEFGIHFEHSDDSGEDKSEDDDRTVQDVLDTLNEEQTNVVHALLAEALGIVEDEESEEKPKTEDGDNSETTVEHSQDNNPGGKKEMAIKNIFEQQGRVGTSETNTVFQHGAFEEIAKRAMDGNSTFKKAMKAVYAEGGDFVHADHDKGTGPTMALNYGVRNSEILFPEAQLVGGIQIDRDRDDWVASVIAGTRKVPYSRLRTMVTDMTFGSARAKGYLTGDEKEDVYFELTERETNPQTVYIRGKLDRDTIIDATTINLVQFQMGLLKEKYMNELARAILIGDGRKPGDKHKIKEDKIRPIVKEHPLYAARHDLPAVESEGYTAEKIADEIIKARKLYKGTGRPTLYISGDLLVELLLSRDKVGRKIYNSQADLEATLRVASIIEVDPLEGLVIKNAKGEFKEVVGILVNLADYSVGTDAGGQLTTFEDFDIDFNQYKYLMEGRMSGALTTIRSAVIFERASKETEESAPRTASLNIDNDSSQD